MSKRKDGLAGGKYTWEFRLKAVWRVKSGWTVPAYVLARNVFEWMMQVAVSPLY